MRFRFPPLVVLAAIMSFSFGATAFAWPSGAVPDGLTCADYTLIMSPDLTAPMADKIALLVRIREEDDSLHAVEAAVGIPSGTPDQRLTARLKGLNDIHPWCQLFPQQSLAYATAQVWIGELVTVEGLSSFHMAQAQQINTVIHLWLYGW